MQFLIVGAALYAASTFLPRRDVPRRNDILVSAGQVEHLASRFARTWRRPPSTDELQGLIDDYVREEVAVREGLAMGLDTDDTIIRRRIRQKLDFIASDVASLMEPTRSELEQYLAAHAETFRIPPRYTFQQVYFDPAKHGDALEDDAGAVLASLRRDPDADLRQFGDATLLDPELQNLTPEDVADLFGEAFATAIESLPWSQEAHSGAGANQSRAGARWQGPLLSSYGLHLVRLDARIAGRIPQLDEVLDAVRREFEYARRNDVKERFYADLLQRYDVKIEWPDDNMAGGGR